MVEKSQSMDITTSMVADRSMNRLVSDTNVSQIGNSIFAPDNFDNKKKEKSRQRKNPLKRLKARMPKEGQAHSD